MKSNDQAYSVYTNVQGSTGNAKPKAPFTARQAVSDRSVPDPSSVLRSDRYPIPNFFEYRMRTSE